MTALKKEDLSTAKQPQRCRLVLVATSNWLTDRQDAALPLLLDALSGGDVASILFAQTTLDDEPFEQLLEPLIAPVQQHGVAAIIVGTPRVASRVGADGVQFSQDAEAIRDAERLRPDLMIGAGNIRSRHQALIIGEADPDYVMFGKPGDDTKPDPRSRNLELGAWWASMIEIPAIVLGGTSLESAVAAARTQAEFVALDNAIFSPGEDGKPAPAAKVREVNRLLDEHAPRFDEIDA